MIIAPIFSALALATSTIIEKTILVKKKVTIKFYETWQFFAISLLMLPLIIFFWKVSPEALTTKNIFIFLGVVLVSIFANYFAFFSIKKAKLSKIEPARMMEPLFVIILAIMFSFIFQSGIYEKETHVLIPALVSGLALIFSHIEKHHLKFKKPFLYAMLGSFLFALELVLSKSILGYYNGITFYFLRCLFIFLFTLAIFRKRIIKGKNNKLMLHVFLVAAILIIYRVILYYGYVSAGIIQTTLIVMLGPIFTYLFAWRFLKEKPKWKNLIAALVILGSITYIIIF